MADDLSRVDAVGQAELVRTKQASPLELVDAAIARIEKVNPQLNAVITSRFEKAREEATAPLPDGPLTGVPFLLKDLDVMSEGDPCHCGMAFLRNANYVAPHSSSTVEKFRAAGLVLLGKTNTPELGLNVTTEPAAYGPSRNPWNTDHSTGGSSGGSAAAVASGMVPAAHASDGGGSIRIPSSECGLVGLKPSRGRLSMSPDFGDFWAGLVTSGVVSRTVRDSAVLLDAIAGTMPGDPYTAPPAARPYAAEVGVNPGKLRIGLMPQGPVGATECHPDCSAAVEQAGRTLESLGHRVELAYPSALDENAMLQTGFQTIVMSWVAMTLAHWGEVLGREVPAAEVEPGTWMFAEIGRTIPAPAYLQAVSGLQAWTRRVAHWWACGFDLLVTPTLGTPPPRIGELVASSDNPGGNMEKLLAVMTFAPQFNVTGQPAISLPLAMSSAGLPIGVQFVSAYGREDLLFQIAAQLEAAVPWTSRTPSVFA